MGNGFEAFIKGHKGLVDDAGGRGEVAIRLRFVSKLLNLEYARLDIGDVVEEFRDAG